MKIHEHQAKDIFRRYNIPIPRGMIAHTPEEAKAIACELGGEVAIKAQVLESDRSLHGGIKFASDPERVKQIAEEMLNLEIGRVKVQRILVEKKIDWVRELYIGMTVDRDNQSIAMIAGSRGGTGVERTALEDPTHTSKLYIDSTAGFLDYQARSAAYFLQLAPELISKAISILEQLYQVFIDYDCSLVEVNPLAITKEGEIYALDAKIDFDDNGLFKRRDEKEKLRDVEIEDPLERLAREMGIIKYVRLSGDIGVIGNGAGLIMATLDMLDGAGGKPAAFLEIGSGANTDKTVYNAMELLLSDPQVSLILFNVFGGFTRCDEVAKGIFKALSDLEPKIPIVVRLGGTLAEEGLELLRNTDAYLVDTMEKAVKKAMTLVSTDNTEVKNQ